MPAAATWAIQGRGPAAARLIRSRRDRPGSARGAAATETSSGRCDTTIRTIRLPPAAPPRGPRRHRDPAAPRPDAPTPRRYYFAAQILGWAPPAAYTVLNQFLKETHLSLLITCLWLAISLPLFHKAGDSSAVHMKEESSDGLMIAPRITLADVGLADKKEGGNGGL